jgi:prepilin-type processing-associated H-X9-DG protein
MAMKPKQGRGFGLTELLVCVHSIVILIILLIPAVHVARKKAVQSQCISNMMQIVYGMMMFAVENDGHFPAAGKCGRNAEFDWTWGGNVSPLPQTDPAKCKRVEIEKGVLWMYMMGMDRAGPYGEGKGMSDQWYASTKNNPYLCPTAGPVGKKRGLSYSMNGHLDSAREDGAVIGMRLTEIYGDAKTILLVDESDLTVNDGRFNPEGDESKSPKLHLKHRDGGNVGFCDGHVAWIEEQRFLEIMKPESGWFSPGRDE